MKVPNKIAYRQKEIFSEFIKILDRHMKDVVAGRVLEMYHIKDIADIMCIHPIHLSNTIKLVTGKSPCHFFEEKIMDIARNKLADPSISIADIARLLTFDTSNFTKFFKRFQGMTPSAYRQKVLESIPLKDIA